MRVEVHLARRVADPSCRVWRAWDIERASQMETHELSLIIASIEQTCGVQRHRYDHVDPPAGPPQRARQQAR